MGAWDHYNPGCASLGHDDPGAHATRGRGPYEGRRRHDFSGNRLDTIEWKNKEIRPVNKRFPMTHPTVVQRGPEENEVIRSRHGILVDKLSMFNPMDVPPPCEVFEEFPFPDQIMDCMSGMSWRTPTPIQIQCWPIALQGFDLVGVAETGSGKTMAYALPMLVHVHAQESPKPGEGPIGLVLLPTKELCKQVRDVIQNFAAMVDLRCESLYALSENSRQSDGATWDGAHIVTTAPGKLLDGLRSQRMNLSRMTFLVIDEADEILDGNFLPQVDEILSQVRPDRQVLLFSATHPDYIQEFAKKMAEVCGENRPGTMRVNVGGIKLAACKTIDQQFWAPGKDEFWPEGVSKEGALLNAIKKIDARLRSDICKALVFVNNKDDVQGLVDKLKAVGITCEGFTSDLAPRIREEMLEKFKHPSSDLPLLVSTNVLGRGHDFKNVKYVINYDMPNRLAEYIHRIGRTGRAGNEGYALTLLQGADLRFAVELCKCLDEVKRPCPEWLKDECKNRNKHYKTWKYQREGGSDPQSQSAGKVSSTSWSGRGKGRRDVFLSQLSGTGLARPPGVLQDGLQMR